MKESVLHKVLQQQKSYGYVNEASIVVFSSLCDFLKEKNILIERLPKSFEEDVIFLLDNFEEFSLDNRRFAEELLTKFNSPENNAFYKNFKEACFIKKDSIEPEQNIYELISKKLSSNKRLSTEYFIKNGFSDVVKKWLCNSKTNLNVYCPYNYLVDIEQKLTANNNVTSAEINSFSAISKQVALICNGLRLTKVYNCAPNTLINRDDTYDIGFSFPPLAARYEVDDMYGHRRTEIENILIADMMNKIKDRFCLLVPPRFAFTTNFTSFIRKDVVTSGRLKAVVGFPGGFIPNSPIEILGLFFGPRDNKQKSIMMMDLTGPKCKDQDKSTRNQFELSDYALKTLTDGLNGKETEEAKKVLIENISKEDHILLPSRYVISEQAQIAKKHINKGDTTLSEVVDFLRVPPTKNEESGKTYFEVSASDINPMGFIESPTKELLLSENNPSLKNQLKKDDIVFAIKGSVGKVGLVTEEHDNWLVNQSFVILRIKDKKWPAEFLFRQLKSTEMKQYIQSKSTGAFIPSLKMSELKDIPLISPTEELINKQHKKHSRQLEITKKIEELKNELEELDSF